MSLLGNYRKKTNYDGYESLHLVDTGSGDLESRPPAGDAVIPAPAPAPAPEPAAAAAATAASGSIPQPARYSTMDRSGKCSSLSHVMCHSVARVQLIILTPTHANLVILLHVHLLNVCCRLCFPGSCSVTMSSCGIVLPVNRWYLEWYFQYYLIFPFFLFIILLDNQTLYFR